MKTTFAAVAALMIAVSPAGAQTPAFMDMQNNTEVLGTDFIGTPVNGKDGQLLGKIDNLVFDQNGRIELAVIGVGGYLGIGEKVVAVPFEAMKSDVADGKHVFVIDATKDQLKAAPTYRNTERPGARCAHEGMAREGASKLDRYQGPDLEGLRGG